VGGECSTKGGGGISMGNVKKRGYSEDQGVDRSITLNRVLKKEVAETWI